MLDKFGESCFFNDPANLLLAMLKRNENMYPHKTCANIFIVTLFILAIIGNNSRVYQLIIG